MSLRNDVLRDRYLQPGESESDMYKRVAKTLANNDEEKTHFHQMMVDKAFFPNTPTLVNAGTSYEGGWSACYAVPVVDTLDGIFKGMWHAGRIHKYFGGTGFNFSEVRPRGAVIHATGGRACGPVSVIRSYNQAADMVRQGGKRQGANMGILNVDHPDLLEFIKLKEYYPDVKHFNVSVGMTDTFMNKVVQGKLDEQWLINDTGYIKIGSNYVRYDPDTFLEHKKHDIVEYPLTVGEVWDNIVQGAWRIGDPGLLYLDTVEKGNTCKHLGRMVATNPCGELPLFPYESCNLGSINIGKYASEDCFQFEEFEDTISWAMRLLDNIIDKNKYPIPEVAEATLLTRKVGLGVMGWHDCLINMGIPYCSDDALKMCDEIGKSLLRTSEDVSGMLAEEKGVFPAYKGSYWDQIGQEMRNASTTAIAPTGTLSSVFAECSSCIEPHFARKFTRQSESGIGTYEVVVPDGETAMEIPYEWHVKHQATWQKWIHNAASKTINMPESASVEDVREAYIMAWEMGCKGITVYRDGSKDKQVLRTVEHVSPGVGHERFGSTLDFATGCGSIHVTCNNLQQRPYEVYVLSEGGCPANNEAIGKVISKYLHDPRLRGGELETVQRITRTLHKVKCMTAIKSKKAAGKSCADIIASRMDKVWADENIEVVKPTCPECGRELRFGGGCGSGECVCGWSGCS